MADTSPVTAPDPVIDRTHPLAGRTALVTGGSRGIGLGISTLLTQLGARVLLVSRREAGLIAAVEEIRQTGVPADAVSYRVAKADSDEDARASVALALERYGSLDILVNNAATNPYFGPLVGIDRGRAEKTVAVNLWGPLSWVQAAWDGYLRDNGGVVLNIASTSGIDLDTDLGWYGTTKAALIQLTRQLAMELAPDVRVNSIAPGLVKTDLSRALWVDGEAEAAAGLPLGRLGTPRDIAEAAAFLCSDAASWITGQTLAVDGGYLVRPTP
ncbi:MAG TPA: SDR family oxidoreductase [Pseudonocardiaceae bacterium]|nr:SDR family oxidoreductase [Pseudonocardiaceae bacterium]